MQDGVRHKQRGEVLDRLQEAVRHDVRDGGRLRVRAEMYAQLRRGVPWIRLPSRV